MKVPPLLPLITGACLLIAAPARSATPRLVWSDEFDQAVNSGPDAAKWTFEIGGGGWGNNELESYTDARTNTYVIADSGASDGKALVIAAVKAGDGSYTSARLKTQGKFTFTYGHVEARLKTSDGQGLWPAWWMLGDNITTVGWPQCGEIDIMETVGASPKNAYGTLHGPGYSGDHGIGNHLTVTSGTLASAYHVYAVDWTPNQIVWSFDGTVYHTVTPASLPSGTSWVFNDQPFFLLLDLAVGGYWPGNPDSTTSFPQKLTVDYVRVYGWPGPAPTSLAGVAGQGQVQLSWVAPSLPSGTTLQGFTLERAADSAFTRDLQTFSPGNVTRYVDTAVTPGTAYSYRVSAVTSGGTTDPSATFTLTLASPPPAPVAADATGIGSTGFTANWSASATATGYRLDVAVDPAFSSLVAGYADRDTGTDLGAAVTGLSPLTTYYYRVRVTNVGGVSENSNVIAVTTAALAPKITSADSTTFTLGLAGRFTATASGTPAPTFSLADAPDWLTLDAASGELRGTPPAGTSGARIQRTLSASNTAGHDDQVFTLVVAPVPDASAAGGTPLTITTLAGTAGASGSTDGTGTAARFDHPAGVAVDRAGNIYAADTDNDVVRKITSAGVVTTFAGTAGASGSADGTGAAARFHAPTGLGIDASDNLYVADTLNNAIRRITPAGVVTTLAGADAGLAGPQGVAWREGTLYVADTNHHRICQIDLTSTSLPVTSIAGSSDQPGSTDATGAAARFDFPSDLAVGSAGELYVVDTENNTLRVITPAGVVTTLAGQAGSTGAADGTGAAARFDHPSALAVDAVGNVIVLDTDNHTVRRIVATTGAVTTIAGLAGSAGTVDGAGSAARFDHPAGIASIPAGGFAIADTNNHTLRLGAFPGAPAITSQPQNASATTGGSASFSVTATGDAPLAYQWRFNGAPIAGATGSTLSLSAVKSSDAGNYSVTVSNALGQVVSGEAVLTVTANSGGGGSGGGGSGGGGGAPGLWFCVLLTLAAGWRKVRPTRKS